MLMPNLASAVAIDVGGQSPIWIWAEWLTALVVDGCASSWGLKGLLNEKEITDITNYSSLNIDAELSSGYSNWTPVLRSWT
jgi:hypothetical protein